MEKDKKKKSIIPTILWIAAGVLFCLYGLVAYKAGSGTSFYMVWFFAGLACFLMELFRRVELWKKLPGFLKTLIIIIFCIGILLFVTIEGFIISGFPKKGEPGLDYIIVLGAQYRSSGPSIVLKYRLDKAYEYLTENPDTIAICSGGQGSNEHIAEGEGMKNYLVERGIDGDRIIVENKSKNTIQNILFSYEFLDKSKDKIGIITNDFHVFRATQIAKKQGGDYIVGIAADSNPIYLPNNMTRECIGVVKDIIMGNM
ncbi:MAG: YdcF family protein [Lachnospiraceae bacterium]|nr:YdcF family protein [Lachnospiraceae bacterium]